MIREILQSITDTGFAPYLKEYEQLKKAKNGEVYLRIVKAYVEAGFNQRNAAQALGVSHNGIAYHLTGMRDTLCVGDISTDLWLSVYLCLQMETIARGNESERVTVEVGGMTLHLTMQRD